MGMFHEGSGMIVVERLTHKRANGIKEGYWSPNKKQELVDTLAAYEDTGLTAEQIREIDRLYAEKCREVTELRQQHGTEGWANRMSDLISRKMLIENLKKFAPEHYSALVNDLIMKQPTVFDPVFQERKHMNDGWIPVEERLPEVDKMPETDAECPEFNVTIRGAKEATTLKYSPFDDAWFDDNGYIYPVIAWRPLPKPYRLEREVIHDEK